VPTVRERLSDSLLRMGTDLALARAELQRRLVADVDRQAYERARSVVALARWCDTAVLWLSWRLRPPTMPKR
jgi:hypothetical protein